VKNTLIFCSLIYFLCFLPALHAGQLSRSEAQKHLQNHKAFLTYKLPSSMYLTTEYYNPHEFRKGSDFYDNIIALSERLRTDGYVTLTQSYFLLGANGRDGRQIYYRLSPTEKLKPFLAYTGKLTPFLENMGIENDLYVVKAYELFSEVTGIRKEPMNENIVAAEYLTKIVPTEMTKYFPLTESEAKPEDKVAYFIEYDDGWRLYKPIPQSQLAQFDKPDISTSAQIGEAQVTKVQENRKEINPVQPQQQSKLGAIRIDSKPQGAKVFLDRFQVGMTPFSMSDIEIGSHVLRVEYQACSPVEKTIVLQSGNMADLGTVSFQCSISDEVIGSGGGTRVKTSLKKETFNPLLSNLYRIKSKVEKAEPETARSPSKEPTSGNTSGGIGGSGVGTDSSGKQPIDFYRALVPNYIENNWVFNEQLVGGRTDLVSVIVIKIMQNGEISDIWFEKKSGNSYFDDSVYKAVNKSNPLPPLPKEYTRPYYELGLIFTPKGLKRS